MAGPSANAETDLARRLSDVESALMFLQRTVDDLNGVILDQQRRLEAQGRELTRLQAMVESLADPMFDAPRRPEDEKPPHY